MATSNFPPLPLRLYSVWYRHMRVYIRHIISNGFPPFVEPLIFLLGIGLGLGKYISNMDGLPYVQFLAAGLLITTAMFTAAFECSFGTFIRLEFEKIYDGMLAAPLTVSDLIIGEMIWAGTKGFFFSLAVLCVMLLFDIIPLGTAVFAPFIGFLTGLMFASISLFITSFVKNINHLNFYFTGFLSPMFFFSGVIFPLSDLPLFIRPFAELFPLTHGARIVRALCYWNLDRQVFWDLTYCGFVIIIFGSLAIFRLKKRMLH